MDSNDVVYVTGYSVGDGTGRDYTTIAYAGSGVALWTNHYNGPAGRTDFPTTRRCLAATANGAAVVGRSDGGYQFREIPDYATVKYVTAFPPAVILSGAYDAPLDEILLRIQGTPGQLYTMEGTDSLGPSDWRKVANQIAPETDLGPGGGIFEFRTPAGQAPSCYYRIVHPAY